MRKRYFIFLKIAPPKGISATTAKVSGSRTEGDGVVSGVFVKIGEAQEKLQHAVALLRLRLGRPFLEIRNDGEGVRKKSFHDLRIDGAAFLKTLHELIGAEKRLVEEMIEAHLFAREAGRNQVGTRCSAANPSGCGIHNG